MEQVYNILINEENEIQIVTYEANIITIDKKEREYVFTQKDLDDPIYNNLVTIQDKVKYLVANNFISAIAFQSTFLRKYQLLQQVYDEIIIDNVCYIITYAVYINVFTGEIYCKKSKKFTIWSKKYLENLINKGYKGLYNSYLNKYINEIDTLCIKPMNLTRKMQDR